MTELDDEFSDPALALIKISQNTHDIFGVIIYAISIGDLNNATQLFQSNTMSFIESLLILDEIKKRLAIHNENWSNLIKLVYEHIKYESGNGFVKEVIQYYDTL